MTFVLVPIAYGVALAATLLLVRHLARRYHSIPARVPLNIRIDGRPSKRSGPKALLWLAPGVLLTVLIALGVMLAVEPPKNGQELPLALAFLVVAEVAWFVAWLLDRQIEIARKMTYRIAPARLLRASLVILVSVVAVIVVAARS
jgi:hypothetical protein